MGQLPRIQLTYRRTAPRNGKWFRFSDTAMRWISAERSALRTTAALH